MKKKILISALLLCALTQLVSGDAARPAAVVGPPALRRCPLQIVNEAALQVGQIYDRSRREIRLQFRHRGEGVLLFRLARSTCPCIAILESPLNQNLFPGDELSLRIQLDASSLTPGPFTRHLILEFSNCESLQLALRGECIQPLKVSPGLEMDLGGFEGVDVMWKRHFELTLNPLAGEEISLVEPPASDRFEFRLLPQGQGRQLLEIRPRLPLPLGEFHERINLVVNGLENYGDLPLLLHGQVRGRAFAVKNSRFVFTRAELAEGRALQRELAIIRVAAAAAQAPGRRRLQPLRQQKHGLSVAVDEQQAGKQELFAQLAQELRLEPTESFAVESLPQAAQLLLRLDFSAEFLQQKPLPKLRVYRAETLLGEVELQLK